MFTILRDFSKYVMLSEAKPLCFMRRPFAALRVT